MFIRLKDITGEVVESERATFAEMLEELPPGADIEEMLEEMINVLGDFENLNKIRIKVNGEDRYFNPANVIWFELHREGE